MSNIPSDWKKNQRLTDALKILKEFRIKSVIYEKGKEEEYTYDIIEEEAIQPSLKQWKIHIEDEEAASEQNIGEQVITEKNDIGLLLMNMQI